MQQRFDTILRVSQAIVERQRRFFEHGEVAMRPMVLREIADMLGLHESTISRVTTQKYMLTPRGTFELKYFFGSHVATDTGGAASATAIRALIKQLIAAEDTKTPLTDSQIADMLGEQGILVARRTIAKYREALQIPPVNLRKALIAGSCAAARIANPVQGEPMNLNLTGHHLEITPAIRDYVSPKLERVNRHFDHVIDVNVVMTVDKLRQKVEANVHVRGKDIHAESVDADMYAAIDALADKLDRQVLKHKEMLKDHRCDNAAIARAAGAESGVEGGGSDNRRRIRRAMNSRQSARRRAARGESARRFAFGTMTMRVRNR